MMVSSKKEKGMVMDVKSGMISILVSNGYIKDADDDDEAYDDFRGYIPFHYSPIHLHLLGSELQRLRVDFQTYETFSLTKKVKTFKYYMRMLLKIWQNYFWKIGPTLTMHPA